MAKPAFKPRTVDLTSGRVGPRLRVWWIPQVPMQPFEAFTDSFVVAKSLLESLAQYDLFQFENRIKPDFCNTGGLSIWDESMNDEGDGKWTDWESDTYDSIDDVTIEACLELDRKFYEVYVGPLPALFIGIVLGVGAACWLFWIVFLGEDAADAERRYR